MEWLFGILVLIFIIGSFVIGIYNRLVKLRNAVREKWAQIDVTLKRRSDLIPNLVETVKGYASHEKETLDAVISARSNYESAKSVDEKIKSANALTQTLGKLFALSEAYPDLKANQNFLKLQSELSETENIIAVARTSYNEVVTRFNNKVEQFPSSIIASMFNFKIADFFEIVDADKEVPKVQF